MFWSDFFFFCSPHTRKYADGCWINAPFQPGKDTDIQWFTRFLLFSRNTHTQTLTHGLIPHSAEPTHTCRYSTDYQESRCNGHLGGKYKKRRQTTIKTNICVFSLCPSDKGSHEYCSTTTSLNLPWIICLGDCFGKSMLDCRPVSVSFLFLKITFFF